MTEWKRSFAGPEPEERFPQMEDLLVDDNGLLEVMQGLDMKKTMAPDRVKLDGYITDVQRWR